MGIFVLWAQEKEGFSIIWSLWIEEESDKWLKGLIVKAKLNRILCLS